MLPDELPFVVRRSRRISKESSSRRIMCLVPVFILETHNQTNYYVCPSSSRRIMHPYYKNGQDTTEPVIEARRYVHIYFSFQLFCNYLMRLSRDVKNYGDRGGCYPSRP